MDIGHKETEEILREIEKRISREYKQAEKEVAAKLDDYLKRFETKDKIWQAAVKSGERTQKEYEQWRLGQIMTGKRWAEMRLTLAEDYTQASQIAKDIAVDRMPDVYAINHNYGTFQVEKGSQLDTSYTLYDRDTVIRLASNREDIIPVPGQKVSKAIKEGKAIKWNEKQIQSVMMQSLLQGEAIPKIASRLAFSVGEMDRKASVRNARTLATGVQNAGRVDSYKRANKMGINTRKQWLAALDSRTRHWHRDLDGVIQDVDKPFENDFGKIMYPGDPTADGANIYNCRCTLIAAIKGFERDASNMDDRYNDKLGDMSYDEWKKEKKSTSDSINKQDKIARKRASAYNKLYGEVREISGERKMSNGQRRSPLNILTVDEIDQVLEQAKTIDIPTDVLLFNQGRQTGFSDLREKIYIRGDIFPDMDSTNLRDRLNVRSVLAHEYYGHYKNNPSKFAVGDWRDEFRASYCAALNTPNLNDEERRMLMLDAFDRAKEAGIPVNYNKEARRLIYGYDED